MTPTVAWPATIEVTFRDAPLRSGSQTILVGLLHVQSQAREDDQL
jgi:hypothetical protein